MSSSTAPTDDGAINLAEVSMTFADVDPTTLSLPGVTLDFRETPSPAASIATATANTSSTRPPAASATSRACSWTPASDAPATRSSAQGQIDQILSAHPEDRRTIFEEAAGINKYKHQKKEALRKLEYTEANLVRITDIIKEVKRQIISLQRQAGKARRYKELFDQLKAARYPSRPPQVRPAEF